MSPAFFAAVTNPKRQGLIAAQITIQPGGKLRRRNLVADLERFGGFAIGVAGLQRQFVGLRQQRFLLELVIDPADRRLHRAVVQPVAHAQSEEVLATVHGFGVETQMLQGRARQTLQFHGEDAEFVERMVLERIGGQVRLAEVAFLEAVGVDDGDAIGLQVANIHLQGRRIHGDQYID